MGFVDIFSKSINKKQEKAGGYIFLSHSHNDIEKVRELRNGLEQNGFEPLCFFLKCLNDDSEIEDLIKREIDSREWFVFANSENARKSKWVSLEREYINRTNSKKIIEVEIYEPNAIQDLVEKISHNLRIFIAYSHKDRLLAHRIYRKLGQKDYQCFIDTEDLLEFGNLMDMLNKELIAAAQNGAVLALITENSVHSAFVKSEILRAIELRGNVIPVLIADVALDSVLEQALASTHQYHLPANPTNKEINDLIDAIGKNIVKRL